MELIRIIEKDNAKFVEAKDLHLFLEVGTDLPRWIGRMIEYGFEENIDYTTFFDGGNFDDVVSLTPQQRSRKGISLNYLLTLDMAKEISMLQRSEKGREARKYFIECEKKLQMLKEAVLSNQLFKIPTTLSEALYLAAEQAGIIEEQSKLIEESKDKVDFYNTVAEAPDCFDFMEAAGILKIPHGKSIAGRNQLFEMLRKLKYIQPNSTLPYKSKVNEGIFKLIEVVENSRVFTKTVITQKGIIHLQKVLKHV